MPFYIKIGKALTLLSVNVWNLIRTKTIMQQSLDVSDAIRSTIRSLTKGFRTKK